MKISEIMKTKFLLFEGDETIYEVSKKLDAKKRREAPVQWKGKFMGMITLSAIASALSRKGILENLSAQGAAKMRAEPIRKFIHLPMFAHIHLEPDMDLAAAAKILAGRNAECIPVLDSRKKLVGVVFPPDLGKKLLGALEFGIAAGEKKKATAKEAKKGTGDTAIDNVLEFVNKKGMTTCEEIAKEFNLPIQTVEGYAQSLETYGLLKIDYTLLGKMKLKRVE